MKIRNQSIAVMLSFVAICTFLGGFAPQAKALPILNDVYSNVYAYAGAEQIIIPVPGQYQSNTAEDGAVDATWQASPSVCPIPGFCTPTGTAQADAHAELFPNVSATNINASAGASTTTSASGALPGLPPLVILSAVAQSTLSVDFTLGEATPYALGVDSLVGATLGIFSGGAPVVSASSADVGSVLNGLLAPGDYTLFAQAYASASGNQSSWEYFDFSLNLTEGTSVPVPEPPVILLVAIGLVGLAGLRIGAKGQTRIAS
jgi:hypothetical protein